MITEPPDDAYTNTYFRTVCTGDDDINEIAGENAIQMNKALKKLR